MEIERKFLIKSLPADLTQYQHKDIEQAYLCQDPVLRIRKLGSDYFFTFKTKGLMIREEIETPLTKETYGQLLSKADGTVIKKTRYYLPLTDGLVIELDIFAGVLEGLCLAEIEFPSKELAEKYIVPQWFGREVTLDGTYHNNHLSTLTSCPSVI